MHNTTEDMEVSIMVVAEIVIVKTMKREDKQTSKIGVEEDVVVEEVIVLIIQMLNDTIVKNMDIYVSNCYAKKKVEEDANLVEEDEGILMMANEGILTNNDMVWYLDTSASNHMYAHKHLFVDIREIEDRHMSFGDSTKVPIKGKGKKCFSQKDGKTGTMKKDVYYVPDLENNILSIG